MTAAGLAPHLAGDPGYFELKQFLLANTGLAYYLDKDEQLAGHIGKRLGALDLPDCASYLRKLEADGVDGPELDKLIAMLTIGETFFFRHQEAFTALRDVVFPDLIRRNQASRKLRIWSAGCSIGAEPYSLAILLQRDLAHLLAGWDVKIIATDINRDVLERARAGRYESWAFRSVPEEIRDACFRQVGTSWELEPLYKETVSFQYHNLVKDPCPSMRNQLDAFDLILCRNVTIYFSPETIRKLVNELYLNLPEGGWLLVGHAEPNVETYRSFQAVNLTGAVLYQKTGAPSEPAWTQLPVFAPAPERPQAAPWFPIPIEPSPDAPAAPLPGPVSEKLPPAGRPGISISADLAAVQQIADRGEIEEAARACAALLEREKLNAMVTFYYALLLEQLGRRQETQEYLRRAVYLDRKFIAAHYYLGLTQQKQGDTKAALRCFRNVLNLLAGLEGEQKIPAADAFTVAELQHLAQMHITSLTKP